MKKGLRIAEIILGIALILSASHKIYKAFENNQHASEENVISEDEYKAQCTDISYTDIARNPNDYKGQKAYFRGKVAQVQESYGKNIVLRVDVTEGEYGWWEDTIYVDYKRKDDNESRVLEDDIITIYGEIKGIKSYTALLGNEISIPHIKAEYIDINIDENVEDEDDLENLEDTEFLSNTELE